MVRTVCSIWCCDVLLTEIFGDLFCFIDRYAKMWVVSSAISLCQSAALRCITVCAKDMACIGQTGSLVVFCGDILPVCELSKYCLQQVEWGCLFMNSELCFQLGRGYIGVLPERLLNLFVVNTSWVFW